MIETKGYLYLLYRNELEMERKAMSMLSQCRQVLHQMKMLWPQYELDGHHNVWILKPGAKSRGRGMYSITAVPQTILFLLISLYQ